MKWETQKVSDEASKGFCPFEAFYFLPSLFQKFYNNQA